jgi:uncharacterized Zn finger protein
MSWSNYSNFEYVSVAERKKRALKKIKALEKSGHKVHPVEAATARGLIAKSFWGKAWCQHLEAFSDFEYRLPRGRSYIRHGAVVDLQIEPQTVTALVSGSELYELTVTIDPLAPEKWAALRTRCQGKIGSLIELLHGRFSDEIMTLVTDTEEGLFPKPKEIHFNCNCPDWADMCKHVAAALYGVGARLDASPELLFKLRGVDQAELIALDAGISDLTQSKSSRRRRTLDTDAVSNVFGIDLDEAGESDLPQPKPCASKKAPSKKTASKKAPAKKAFKPTAAKLRKLRQQHGLSKAAFARELGVSAPTISNWEKKTGPLQLSASALEAIQRLHAVSQE